MKKITLALFIYFFICSFPSFAGDSTSKYHKTYFILSVGPSFNRVGGSRVDEWKDISGYAQRDLEQKNAFGFAADVQIQKAISKLFYLKSGLGYVQKQVSIGLAIEGTPKDNLNTGYITIPVFIGTNISPATSRLIVWAEVGPTAQFAIVKKSTNATAFDFKTKSFVASANAGAGITFPLNSKSKLVFSYHFIYDLTNAHSQIEYAATEYSTYYKYRSHVLGIGIQCEL